MKTLLVNPNRTYASSGTQAPVVALPLGLLWIAACFEQQKLLVRLLDCLNQPETRISETGSGSSLGISREVIEEHLLAEKPDLVGIGCPFTAQWENALEVLRISRALLPQSTIVLGGPHATVCANEILRENPEVDYILAGEGEESLPLLARVLQGEARREDVPGLIWRNVDGEVTANPLKPIENLDTLPLPAYHLYDFQRYFDLQSRGFYVRGVRPKSVSIITSRGCPFTCTFCSIHLSMGHKWRAHSAAYTLHHMRYLIDQYGVSHFQIEDDNFTLKRARVEEICRGLIAEDKQITWETPNGVRADLLSDDLLITMKQSGCIELAIAAESGDQKVLDTIVKKKLNLQSIENAAKLAHRHDIRLGCFFVIGFPGETKKQIRKTIHFALRLYRKYNCFPMLNVATPLPGTELTRIVQEKGYLADRMTAKNLASATSREGRGLIRTEEFDPDFIQTLCAAFRTQVRLIHLFYLLTHLRALREELHSHMRRLISRPHPSSARS
ncbi:MAG: cobalamin-dependent protein [Terracidiphilus sp.]|nr:cobalamin-dependent protein [Terracidiphilus sp.]